MDFNLPQFDPTVFVPPKPPSAYSYSDTQFWLTNFGQSVLMQVTEISYRMPVLMIFKGYVNGVESTLIQHVNQLSFLLTSVKVDPERPKQKIGFVTEEE